MSSSKSLFGRFPTGSCILWLSVVGWFWFWWHFYFLEIWRLGCWAPWSAMKHWCPPKLNLLVITAAAASQKYSPWGSFVLEESRAEEAVNEKYRRERDRCLRHRPAWPPVPLLANHYHHFWPPSWKADWRAGDDVNDEQRYHLACTPSLSMIVVRTIMMMISMMRSPSTVLTPPPSPWLIGLTDGFAWSWRRSSYV